MSLFGGMEARKISALQREKTWLTAQLLELEAKVDTAKRLISEAQALIPAAKSWHLDAEEWMKESK